MTDSDIRFHERYMSALPSLTPAERKIGEHFIRHPDEVLDASALQIAAATGTSDATVIRTARTLGYKGLRELKRELLGDVLRRRDMSAAIGHNLDQMDRTGRPIMAMLADSVALLEGFRQDFDDEAFDEVAKLVAVARRTHTYGLGPGSAIAQFLALHLKRVGCDAQAMTQTGYRVADDLLTLAEGDVVVLFAPYHQVMEVEVVVDHAASVGVPVVLVTEALGESLRERVSAIIRTPATSSTFASESIVPLTVAYALAMRVAGLDKTASSARGELFNELSSRFTGSREMPSPPFPMG